MIRRPLRRDRRAATSVEFAIVGTMLCLVTFGIVETSLLWWLRTGMEAAASMTARCGAIGYTYNTSTCTSPTATQNYAVSAAQTWTMTLAHNITASDVTVNGRVTNSPYCNNAAGSYFSVSISYNFGNLPPPLGGYSTLVASACYPMQ